ncbi:MAG: SusC/RagA family TonB-linked outer membrane protein, partial [Gemmatimonadota bacterium]|nr:SusC/RagA family TonB-linked outer membrane protein [Gemmatimonadota bacterium]
ESLSRTLTVVAGMATSDFALNRAIVSLDDIVVTATGEQRAREIPNAVGNINAEAVVAATPTPTINELLRGRSPGVTVLQSSGTAGVGASIKIRGNSSISLGNEPIIYVDGARVNNDNNTGPGIGGQGASRLNDINPADIERVEIVKGPAAATLYGTEASAGVIQIFTKRGLRGEPQWTVRSDYGFNQKTDFRFPDNIWNPLSFGLATDTLYAMNLLEEYDPFANGAFQTVAASVRGGTDIVTYFLSGEFQSEEGTLPNNGFDRFYTRANFQINAAENWDMAVNAGYTSNFLSLPDNDNNGFGFIGVGMIGFPWNHLIQASDPNSGGAPQATCPLGFEYSRQLGWPLDIATSAVCPSNNKGGFFGNRSFEDVATRTNAQNVERFTGSVAASFRPTTYWSNKLTLGYDLVADRIGTLTPVDPTLPFGSNSEGFRSLRSATNRNLTLDYTGTINYSIGDLVEATTSAGVQYYRTVTESSECTGEVFPSGATTCSNAVTTTGDEGYVETKTLGVYFQQQFGYQDRLFLTPGIRFDDNSSFGADFDIATYPKVGVSYVAIEEGISVLDQLKLRMSWGRSGRQPGTFDALKRFAASKVSFQGSDVLGVTPLNLGNDSLRPEIGEESEIGFDAGLFGGRMNIEATYYLQNTTDAIVLKPLAPSLGFPQAQFVNLSRVENRGLELGVDVVALDQSNMSWDWTINFATNRNEVTDLVEPVIFGLGGSSQRHTNGFPFGSYFSEKIIVGTGGTAEVEPTADADDDDHQFIGQPQPEWEGSVSTTFSLGQWLTLYAFLDFKGGHQLFNSTEEFRCGFLGGGENGGICAEIYEKDGSGNYTDDALIKQHAASIGAEAPWIEDADFAKLRTVSVKFNLPNEWTSMLGVNGASLTFAGQNLITWTGYTGADPEINWAGQANAARAEFLTMPIGRRFTTTLSFNF